MAATPLVNKTKFGVSHVMLTREAGGKVTETQISQSEVNALLQPGSGPPAGVSPEDWYSGKVTVAADIPDYGGGQVRLAHGEICELSDRFEVGVYVKERDRTETVIVQKTRVNVSRAGGLTIAKSRADAWGDGSGILSIQSGVLTTKD